MSNKLKSFNKNAAKCGYCGSSCGNAVDTMQKRPTRNDTIAYLKKYKNSK